MSMNYWTLEEVDVLLNEIRDRADELDADGMDVLYKMLRELVTRAPAAADTTEGDHHTVIITPPDWA